MRSINVLLAALTAAPLAVSAAGTLGFALGMNNPDGSCKQTSDYEADFKALKQYTTLVRTYAAGQCNQAQNIIPAAKNAGFQVLLGVWSVQTCWQLELLADRKLARPDTEESYNTDVAALNASVPGNEDVVFGITVGSETLYRGNFTGEQLLGKIQDVQSIFPNVLIGTADSWNKYADGTADPLITGGVKLL
jgi:glucan 1,3-beta-glucosidase